MTLVSFPFDVEGETVGAYHLSILKVGALELVSIEVFAPHRGRGFAHAMLEEITRMADSSGASLTLQVLPDPSKKGAPASALYDLYEAHGFFRNGTTNYMFRPGRKRTVVDPSVRSSA